MEYLLDAVTFQADMSPEGMAKITAVWNDVDSGRLPLMMREGGTYVPGRIPVTEYTDYAGVNSGEPITITIRMVSPDHMQGLEQAGGYRRYDTVSEAGSIDECSAAAWNLAQQDEAAGKLAIDYSLAVESTVPAEVAPDGKAHCTLLVKEK